MPDYLSMEAGYGNLWKRAEVLERRKPELAHIEKRIKDHQEQYENIEKRTTGVPWFLIAALHSRESSLNFNTHLHNGDPLSNYTYHVPAGRPHVGHGPPFSFVESAVDALVMPPHQLNKVQRWSVERILYEAEKYNGFGYIRVNENSPYLWSWTTCQQRGKYVADGQYSSTAWDSQEGVVATMKTLAASDKTVDARLQDFESKPPPDVVAEQTKRERAARAAGGGVTVAGGGTKAATAATAEKSFALSAIEWSAIGIGVAILIVGVFLVVRRTKLVTTKWAGA